MQISFAIPDNYILRQNHPNPFNPSTIINSDAKSLSHIIIIIYDIKGRQIELLTDKQYKVDSYEIKFSGKKLSSGVYFYRIIAKSEVSNIIFQDTKKLILLK